MKLPLKLCGSLQTAKAYPGIFWASVLDNDRMGTKPRGYDRKAKSEERWGFELMLSLSLCDDCHRGSLSLWFYTMADNNRTDGQIAMYVCKDLYEGVCLRA